MIDEGNGREYEDKRSVREGSMQEAKPSVQDCHPFLASLTMRPRRQRLQNRIDKLALELERQEDSDGED